MATMNSGLGGASGYGENSFTTLGAETGNLDDGSRFIDISSVFPSGLNFFGTTYTGLHLNTNGLITFDSPNTTYSPSGVSGLADPAIAPFWTDIDISKGGDIHWDLDPTNGKVTITWEDVAPYSGTGTTSFQVVLTDNGMGNFDIEFIYESIGYTDGGFGAATTGITDGGAVDYELEGSGDPAILANYTTNDFDNGDPVGTYSLPFEDGLPPPATVEGTSGGDTISLGYTDADGDAVTTDDDVIQGLDGTDSIDGDLGDDTIRGGAGDDTILSGQDTGTAISWTQVNNGDNQTGTSGTDYYSFDANAATDTATVKFNNSAGSGDGDGVVDYLQIESTDSFDIVIVGDFDMGTDKIVLTEMYTGVSTVFGTGYFDITITYADSNSQCFRLLTDDGYVDTNVVFTTSVPDQTDDDILYGEDDADTFLIFDSPGNDTIMGGEGGTDDDTIDLSAMTGPVTVAYTGDEAGTITDGTYTITFSEIENMILTDQADSVDATADTAGVTIAAGAGNDTISSGSGNDSIDFGDGDNSVTAGAGDDFVGDVPGNPGFTGSNYVDLGTGNDTAYTGYGDDTVLGGDGDDDIYTQWGEDSVDGGDGNDSIVNEFGNSTLEGGAGADTIVGGFDNQTIDGGAGNDSLTGDDGDDVFVVSGGADTITDFNTGNTGGLDDGDTTNNDFVDLSGHYDHLSELKADFDDDGLLNQSNDGVDGVDYSDNTSFGAGSLTFSGANAASFTNDNTGVVCFTAGTSIETEAGPVPVELLRPGDRIVTKDNGVQPLLWTAQRHLGPEMLERHPHLRPIVVSPGLIDGDRDLIVSPQHGVLIRRADGDETLVRATHLARMRGGRARVAQGCREVTYVHLMFGTHQIVFANGAPSESFYPGPQAVSALQAEPLRELLRLFPGLRHGHACQSYGPQARVFARFRDLPGHERALDLW